MSAAYKERLYATYLADHLTPRKGGASLDALRTRSVRWDKTLRAFLPEDRSAVVADLGCGYGSVVWWLQQRGYANAGGVDVSHDQIEQGTRLGVRNLQQGDVLEFLRDRTAQYDLLIARDLFEHLTKEDTLEGLTLCREALRPGGALLLQVPNGESPFAGRIIYGDFTHETAFTQASLNQVLRAAGFDSVICHPVRPVVYGIKSWLRSLVWRVVEAAIVTAIVAEVGPVRPIVTQNLLVVAEEHRARAGAMTRGILLLGNYPPPYGGVPRYIENLAPFLVSRGWRVHVLSIGHSGVERHAGVHRAQAALEPEGGAAAPAWPRAPALADR